MAEKTIFQKIWDRDIPSYEIFRDEQTGLLAILDRNQATPGHTLVIDKEAVEQWQDVSPEQFVRGQHLSQIIAKRMMKVLDPQPLRILRGTFGYEVPHWHDHVIPSYDRSDTQNIFTKKTPAEPDELVRTHGILAFSSAEADQVREQLAELTMPEPTLFNL